MTREEMDAIPENGGIEAITDLVTGHTVMRRKPARFLTRFDDVLCYTDPRTSRQWFVGKDENGKIWKERMS